MHGFLRRLGIGKTKTNNSMIEPQVLEDSKKIVELLRNSPFYSSMSFPVLRLRFSWKINMQGEGMNKRLVDALTFLQKVRVLDWAGGGSNIVFNRKRLVIPVIVGNG